MLTAPRAGRGSEFIPLFFPASSRARARIRRSQLLSWSEVHSCGALIFFSFLFFPPQAAARRYIASPQNLQPLCTSSHCTFLSSHQPPEGLCSPAFPSVTDIDPFPTARHASRSAATGGPTRARLRPCETGLLVWPTVQLIRVC